MRTHPNNQIIKHKVGLLNLAEELQNVSRACKVMGVSRDTFYRYQELVKSGDIDALINKSRRVPNLKNRVDDATEQAVIDFAIQYPAYGQHRTRCLVPDFNGAIFSDKWKEALWDKFYTAAPQRHRQCVEQYKIVKRA